MQPNPVLQKLHFDQQDRLVVIHADDVGMCQASAAAFPELEAFGIVSSGAVMVPCPWFPTVAKYAREKPDTDLGVHMTLTCEWQAYRWGPVSSRDPGTGMLDEEGYFHRRSQGTQANATPEAVSVEMSAQVERAQTFGIPLTHIDTHMGTVAHPKFMQDYIKLALSKRVPFLMFRLDETGWRSLGLDADSARFAAKQVMELEEMGIPLLDSMASLPLDGDPAQRLEVAKATLAGLKPGVTHFIIHPAKDTPELRAIAPDWACRAADYATFLKDELAMFIQQQGIHVIGYRMLKNLYPPQ